ncbi:MOSC domain-containing protein [Actinospica sp. MGRD01-02]|uniref:MOSC domain-containing protein n=1 Tax=Actinospica acidithermotolerans TaxID=2828514 RepID=A0A941ILF6_9ACTN|nr:MOSC N-terminal beta barrel domain-containing protein [Actinospica acidithermotolerans]MBR7827591.1 MOSC domain-containing protein [Actinospica acidithermotolerans]
MREVGTIEELWRYPVKSMLGQRLAEAKVDEHGLPGDRRLALVDRETGRIASAKTPRLWRELLKCVAAIDDGARARDDDAGSGGGGGGGERYGAALAAAAVRITLPGAKPLWTTDADVDERLSSYTGRSVHLTDTPPEGATLERSIPDAILAAGVNAEVDAALVEIGSGSPPGTFVDFAPLHLITTSTLDRIAELSPRGAIEPQRYRPNLVIRTTGRGVAMGDFPATGFLENDWLGREVRIGPDLLIEIIAATPRCAIPTLEHGPLPRDPMALRTVATHNRIPPLADVAPEPCAGAYARVIVPGRIEPGDKVLVSVD